MGVLSPVFAEFARYYKEERCGYAPANPRWLFNLAIKTLYRKFRKRMTIWAFMSEVYFTLGARDRAPRGLFQTFDPEKYHGELPLERHFANLFKQKLWGRLLRATTPIRLPRLGVRYTMPVKPEEGLGDDIVDAVHHLEERDQMIIRATYWEDESFRKIARKLLMDRETVRRLHDRAIGALREYFEKKVA